MERDRIVNLLNDLIHVVEDSHMEYQRGAEDCPDEDLKALLNDMAAQRGAIVRDLQLQVATIGGAPEATGTMMGQAHRMVEQIRAALGRRDCAAVLEELIAQEDRILERLSEAGAAPELPAEQRRVIEGHAARIAADRDRLRGRLRAPA